MTDKPRKSLFRRFLDWFRKPTEDRVTEPPRPVPITYKPDRPTDALIALCRGDVYEFRVRADIEWTGEHLAYDAVVRLADKYQTSLEDHHRRQIWQIARNFGPHQAADAERAIQRALGTLCYEDRDGRVKCTSHFEVRPDPKVTEHLKKYVLQDIDSGSEATLARRRVQAVNDTVHDWSEVLVDLGVSPVKLAAAALTDARFANTIEVLAQRRKESGQDLAELLRQAAKDHGQLGMYEFAELYAELLAAYQKQMETVDSEFVRQVMDIEPTEPAR